MSVGTVCDDAGYLLGCRLDFPSFFVLLSVVAVLHVPFDGALQA